jgi:hypothetical protein
MLNAAVVGNILSSFKHQPLQQQHHIHNNTIPDICESEAVHPWHFSCFLHYVKQKVPYGIFSTFSITSVI